MCRYTIAIVLLACFTSGAAERILVHGHRGARARRPENTIPAFEYAIAQGVDALEMDMNHYLTVTDREYYADTNRMFFMLGYGGCGFKKVYRDPIKRRPVSRAVDAADIIVSDNEVSLHDCGWPLHDDRPTLNSQGQPLHVFETPVTLATQVWTASARRAAGDCVSSARAHPQPHRATAAADYAHGAWRAAMARAAAILGGRQSGD